MERNDYLPLFESKAAKGRGVYWFYALSTAVGISLICTHRVTHFPQESGLRRWAWTGLFMAELWFITYWIITQFARYRPLFRHTFKDRLSRRYEDVLPGIDIFVSTADPKLEPPLMVVDTVLSVMAYDYPPEKLNIYLSDDGCSDLMFYALLEASEFARFWLPFCRSFNVEPRAPGVYFSTVKQAPSNDLSLVEEWRKLKKFYEEMEARITENMELERVPDHCRKQHKGFRKWESDASRRDHNTILEVLIDGRDTKQVDIEGKPLPMLVYLAREKRPSYPHNFKAGAMNALIRVSSSISNSPIILNVDCDHYSSNCKSVRDALCFFMDEQQSHNIAFVQYPQYFDNITKNDIYGNSLRVAHEIELAAVDAHGGPLYIGSCCFHRRDALTGKNYEKGYHINWRQVKERAIVLEETAKLASCSYEENSSWGKEMGLKYGCPVEDVITGLSIKCKGWRSVLFNPRRRGFLGVAPTTLLGTLIQHTRWSEGHFQIFLSKYNPLIYGHGKIPLQLQVSYLCFNLWGANCLATLYYVIVPPFCLLKSINLFPQLSSIWALPYAYVFVAKYTYSLGEYLWCGGTLQGWYNDQRIWLYKRVTCYFYGFCHTILRYLGFSKLNFAITGKNVSEDVSKRYEKEIMEFGTTSSMFVILATIALFNLLTSISIGRGIIVKKAAIDIDSYALQILLSGVVVIINIPLFEALFLRKDEGRMPASVTYQSLILASLAYVLGIF